MALAAAGKLIVDFGARAEAVADTPLFRIRFKRHRCVVAASEWLKRSDGKQPCFIQRRRRGEAELCGRKLNQQPENASLSVVLRDI
jgi:hypothetical protein